MECLINDLPIYYEEHGHGKPVLCLHGFPENHLSMKGCVEPFFQNVPGYRRIYLDMPGMGKTPARDWVQNADIMLDTLKKFVDKIIGNESFLLIGFSYGGYMALGMAHDANMKVDGVFLIAPVTVTAHGERKLPDSEESFIEENLKDSIAAEDIDDFDDFFLEDVRVATMETWQRYKSEILPAYKVGADGALPAWNTDFCKNYRNDFGFSFEPQLKTLQFSKPMTVLTGRLDNSTGYKDPWDVLNHLSYLSYVVLDGIGHNVQIENPEAFNFHMQDWLSRVRRTGL
jgi:pimeloyl-ACP methyl ester carboxylesterase